MKDFNNQKLELALMGKTKSSGGLNVNELKILLAKNTNVDIVNLKDLSRKELEAYGKKMLNKKMKTPKSSSRKIKTPRSSPKKKNNKIKTPKSPILNERLELLKKSTEYALSPKKSPFSNKYDQGQYTEIEKKYCRCIAHVTKKGNVTKKSPSSKKGGPYNPYAVCQSSVKPPRKHGVIKCSKYYANDYNLKENDEFIPMAKFHGKSPVEYNNFLNNLKD